MSRARKSCHLLPIILLNELHANKIALTSTWNPVPHENEQADPIFFPFVQDAIRCCDNFKEGHSDTVKQILALTLVIIFID